jgi:hypothetical protein
LFPRREQRIDKLLGRIQGNKLDHIWYCRGGDA